MFGRPAVELASKRRPVEPAPTLAWTVTSSQAESEPVAGKRAPETTLTPLMNRSAVRSSRQA